MKKQKGVLNAFLSIARVALRREERQIEYALTYVLTEFGALRNSAISVRRNEQVYVGLHFEDNRDATRNVERVVAHVCTSGSSHIDGCRDDGSDYAARGYAHYDVLRYRNAACARTRYAVRVGVCNLNRYRDCRRDAGKTGSVGNRGDGESGYGAHVGGGRTADERQGQCGIGRSEICESDRAVDACLHHAGVEDFSQIGRAHV